MQGFAHFFLKIISSIFSLIFLPMLDNARRLTVALLERGAFKFGQIFKDLRCALCMGRALYFKGVYHSAPDHCRNLLLYEGGLGLGVRMPNAVNRLFFPREKLVSSFELTSFELPRVASLNFSGFGASVCGDRHFHAKRSVSPRSPHHPAPTARPRTANSYPSPFSLHCATTLAKDQCAR